MDDISLERQKEIQVEVLGNVKRYVENCSNNYSEYVSASLKLFPEQYKKITTFDEKYDILKHLSEYDAATESSILDLQIKILKKVIKDGIYTPGTYERLAKAYEKNNDPESAYKTCLSWFETDFWKLPNTSNGSLRILKRLDRLEKNLITSNFFTKSRD